MAFSPSLDTTGLTQSASLGWFGGTASPQDLLFLGAGSAEKGGVFGEACLPKPHHRLQSLSAQLAGRVERPHSSFDRRSAMDNFAKRGGHAIRAWVGDDVTAKDDTSRARLD